MMKMKMMNRITCIIILFIAAVGCRQDYNPKPIATATNYLVVEGLINTGTDSTTIKLSRTVPLTSKTGTAPELGATVTITSSTGSAYPCIETGKGFYKAAGLNTASGSFGLKINTTDGKTYQSDLVLAKNSPPIDSVYYKVENNGVQIYADTHDPSNNTRYYRWDFSETYEYHTPYQSIVYFQPPDTILSRRLDQYVYECWRSDTSTNVTLNTSAKLASDVISQNKVQFVESTSEKLESTYSILVKQYALTADAYNYLQQLKKNTEQLGSVFDPQPSELPGNIHCTSNPSEPVIGFISAGTSVQSRVFITNRALPAWKAVTPYDECKLDTLLFSRVLKSGLIVNEVELYIYNGVNRPVYPISRPGGPILGYSASSNDCIDCTLRGTRIKPSYWQGN